MLSEILKKYNLLNETHIAVLGNVDFSDLPNFNFREPLKFAFEKN